MIVVEDLRHLRRKRGDKKFRRLLHSWSYGRLRSFLTYKAEARGCKVVAVKPYCTSRECSRCGYMHPSNRRSQSVFKCRACGLELNADLNAARNIARRYLAGGGIAAAGGPQPTGLLCRPLVGQVQTPCG